MSSVNKQVIEESLNQLPEEDWTTWGEPGWAREGLVRERLYTLLSTLGELPLDVHRPRPWGGSWRSALDKACPPGYLVLRGGQLADRGLDLEDLVVGPIGIVVVGHTDQAGRPPGAHRSSASRQRSGGAVSPACTDGGSDCPSPVRETLRRAFALRAWLKETRWDGIPVFAAVCSPRAPEHRSAAPLLLDGLWVGAINYFGPWLAGAEPSHAGLKGKGRTQSLEGSGAEALARFLRRELHVR